MSTIEVFFDCSSPWTYLGFEAIQPVAERHSARLVWKPILVGGIFNTVNPSVYESRTRPVPAKAAYMLKDLADWAKTAGLKIRMPPSVFPVNSARAMRACIVLEPAGRLAPFARAVFRAYWGDDADISQPSVLSDILASIGEDAGAVLAGADADDVRATLRANTEDLISRGGFGSPTFFVDGADMYFGNDRVGLVDAVLAQR